MKRALFCVHSQTKALSRGFLASKINQSFCFLSLVTHPIPCQVVFYGHAFVYAPLSAWDTHSHFTSLTNTNQSLTMPSWLKPNLTAQIEMSTSTSAQTLYPPGLLTLCLQHAAAFYLSPSTKRYAPQSVSLMYAKHRATISECQLNEQCSFSTGKSKHTIYKNSRQQTSGPAQKPCANAQSLLVVLSSFGPCPILRSW